MFVPLKNETDNPSVNQEDQKANIGGKRAARFLLAMPDELRAAIKRAAYIAGRTETAEINMRLAASLRTSAPPSVPALTTAHSWTNPRTETTPIGSAGVPLTYPNHATQALTTNDRPSLSDHDQAILAIFRQLPPDKQLSLLTLLR